MSLPSILAGTAEQPGCVTCHPQHSPLGSTAMANEFHRLLQAMLGGGGAKSGVPGPIVEVADGLDEAARLTATQASVDTAAGNMSLPGLAEQRPLRERGPDGSEAALSAVLPAAAAQPLAEQVAQRIAEQPLPRASAGLSLEHHSSLAAATIAAQRQFLPARRPEGAQEPSAAHLLLTQMGAEQVPVVADQALTADTPARTVPLAAQPTAHALMTPDRTLDHGKVSPMRESLVMQLPLRAPGWEGELAQRLVWMAGRQAQWAEISLNPPHLGSLEVHLSLRGNDASAYFYTPHAAVREALDENLSRLREMLAGVGISLGQAQVSQESFGERRQAEAWPFPVMRQTGSAHESQPQVNYGHGLVDLYV